MSYPMKAQERRETFMRVGFTPELRHISDEYVKWHRAQYPHLISKPTVSIHSGKTFPDPPNHGAIASRDSWMKKMDEDNARQEKLLMEEEKQALAAKEKAKTKKETKREAGLERYKQKVESDQEKSRMRKEAKREAGLERYRQTVEKAQKESKMRKEAKTNEKNEREKMAKADTLSNKGGSVARARKSKCNK